MADDYFCLLDNKINKIIIFEFGIYLKYISASNKDIFEKYFDIKIIIKNLRNNFGDNFLKYLSPHILSCISCKKNLNEEKELIEETTYICNKNYIFNATTIGSIMEFERKVVNKDILIKIFGEDYNKIINEHFKEHKECRILYQKLANMYHLGKLLFDTKKLRN